MNCMQSSLIHLEGVYPTISTLTLGILRAANKPKYGWLYQDLKTMYLKYPQGGVINLWCDGPSSEEAECVRKRKRDTEATNKRTIERDVDNVYQKLLEKHGSSWDTPKLRRGSLHLFGPTHSFIMSHLIFLHSRVSQ